MSIAEIIDGVDSQSKTLTVFNDDEPEPLIRMLERMVDAPDVELRRAEAPRDGPANVVVLAGSESESNLAISTIESVSDSVLMVNSDLYVTGTRPIDAVETPEVLANLAGTTFTVSGKQKMLLIEISRHVESLAWQASSGELHSGFQYLSRIADERGTKRVYDRLANTGTDVHVYGVPDGDPGLPDDVAVYGQDTPELRESWFVVHAACPDDRKAALLATEVGPNEWTGFWTFDGGIVDDVWNYLSDTYRN